MENWTSLLGSQIGAGVIITHLIEWIKKSNMPGCGWLNEHSENANKWVSFALAALVTIGFNFQMAGTFSEGAQLTISIPPADKLIEGAMQLAGQFGIQQTYFKNTIKPKPTPFVAEQTVNVQQQIVKGPTEPKVELHSS